jgi:hypothetical protein
MKGDVGSTDTRGNVIGEKVAILIGETKIAIISLGFGGIANINRGGNVNIGFANIVAGNVDGLAVHPGVVPPSSGDFGNLIKFD